MSRLHKEARWLAFGAGVLVSCAALGQNGAAMPPPPAGAYPQPQQMQAPGEPRQSPVRNAFANTLLTLLNGALITSTAGTSQLVTGALSGWFNRKTQRLSGTGYPQQAYAGGYPQPGYPQGAYGQQGYPPAGTQPYPPGIYPTDPNASYSTPPAPGGTYTASAYPTYAPTTYYDPTTGAPTNAGQYSQINTTDSSTLYAGLAYEVLAVGAAGTSVPVNPATYEFHTGDKFIVQYRPSMPGRMTVYNINPAGMQTQIDSVEMAAGQLSTLGPYQFAATKGEESLRLVLSPCSSQQLLTATRDIVNAGYDPYASAGATNSSAVTPGYGTTGTVPPGSPMQSTATYGTAAPGTVTPSTSTYGAIPGAVAPSAAMPSPYPPPSMSLGSCSTVASRAVGSPKATTGVRTRDIRNVALDNGTSFALDPVSQQELTSGAVAPREVTIAFHHR